WQEDNARSCDFLFAGMSGGYRDTRTMQLRLARICDELNIKGVHMHTLRHTFATRCLEHNIGHEVLCEVLGHSSPQITLRHYSHCTPERIRQSMERMELAL
ncbi:tyrosine-type recombinase/integrase, partial [Lawsonibacter sp. OA9]|nr:tyrosine-type recombinase/integrase [Lawsonibacter sp. OA9]